MVGCFFLFFLGLLHFFTSLYFNRHLFIIHANLTQFSCRHPSDISSLPRSVRSWLEHIDIDLAARVWPLLRVSFGQPDLLPQLTEGTDAVIVLCSLLTLYLNTHINTNQSIISIISIIQSINQSINPI
jgi:hypothetical protein